MPRNRRMIVSCLDATAPTALNHVEFPQQGMQPDFGAGFVQQDELAAGPLFKGPSKQHLTRSAEAVDHDACHGCALVAENLLVLGAYDGK